MWQYMFSWPEIAPVSLKAISAIVSQPSDGTPSPRVDSYEFVKLHQPSTFCKRARSVPACLPASLRRSL